MEIRIVTITTVVVVAALLPVVRSAPQQVPCFFIFGDSLNDCGNNNDLDTVAKANYKPYGIDYPGGPTGRFTNGKTIVDFLAEDLGFDKPISPFTTAKGDDILRGVNYASGSAGILDDSGSHLGRNVPLGKQVDNHKVTFTKIAAMKGNNESATAHLNTCLYYMGIGSNDYLNNYFVPDHYDSGKRFTVLAFATQLVSVYNEKIRTLYQYGARKIVVVGLGKIGCVPYTMKLFGTNGMNCVESSNSAAKAFNMQLQKLVVRLNLEIKDAKFIFVNTFGMGDGDPKLLGFEVMNKGCCESRADGQCAEGQVPCGNRGKYIFWDSFHPTEPLNKATAARTYKSFTPTDNDPFDIQSLVTLNIGKLLQAIYLYT
uniref:Zinc finger FYVE domain containing protein n=1 Tax=Linum usitatissimum TaxID=4006 RepID=A0A165G0H4_LINUS|nr:zinc finger FYVE domain containing protein [Linum usitatissimum]